MKPTAPAPHAGATPSPAPMNAVTTTVCPCCNTARWFCPSCGIPGNWPAPSPAPSWPVELDGTCPSCRASLSLQITGYKALPPAVTALERALGLPPAMGQREHGKGK